ncbi:lantibiotic dehydratase family protein [Nonomuraea sediminis]|uniref:lantibiotic dehydratase family protein n=1 Tax=Nonomuraea sediminis TaxID=2835864 RepID=UPI001BDC35D4|nr:lantibiotic dehydratase family protein [Nonomuraea sediminis]
MKAHLSGPVMARVAGLPADVLDLAAAPTAGLLAELARITDELDELAPRLIEALFALVPRLDDDVPLRRQVLAGKRAANRLATLPWDDDVERRVRARLDPAARVSADTWIRLSRSRDDLADKLAAQLAADRAQALSTLRAALDRPEFARSLALAAPDWIRYGKRDTPRHRQTLYSYVSRAAVKTSPLSGLTTVGLAGTTGRGQARSRAATTLAHQALWHVAHQEESAGLLRYRPATLKGEYALHSEVVEAEGIIWRQDRVVEADHARPWLDRLDGDTLTLAEITRAVGGERPFTRFLRLMDSGLLHPVPPWKRDEDPFQALARVLGDAPEARAVAEIGELGGGAWRGDVPERLAAGAEVGELSKAWTGRPKGLIYEDRETDLALPDPCALPAVQEDLAGLTARIRPWVFRSHVYDLLVERFVAEFGRGGACRDPLDFLMRLVVDGDANPPLERAAALDMKARPRPGERAWLPVGPTSAPPGTALLFQIEAASQAEVEAGRYRLVVNNFGYGGGGLFSRFGTLLGEGVRGPLAEHVAACWPGGHRRELVAWTECNTVQSECTGLLPPLVLPGEVGGPGGITLEGTTLAHDQETDTLSLFDMGGEPIGLAYLGLIPNHILQSYVRLLAVLADPWINAAPHSDYTMGRAGELQAACGADVVALPRVAQGRVVVRRASWVAPIGALPEPGDDDAALAMRADRFRRAHGLPEEVFVHQLGGASMGMAGERKPLWVSLASPLSIGMLHQWLRPGTTHVRIVEALPERHLHPQLDREGRRRAVEYAVLVRWPRQR